MLLVSTSVTHAIWKPKGFSILHKINPMRLRTVLFLLITISRPQKKTPHPPKYIMKQNQRMKRENEISIDKII